MANRLADEKSPYLLQHKDNPVDWYPWGDEAFARAKAEDKPVFLSVGYSTCHWCHVMAHESFENDATAELLNADFVSIKLDREERPDVDSVYMTAVQAMTGQGGWPMTVFMTPEGKPFFAGTYFPPEDKWGRPGFPTLVTGVLQAWKERRAELETQGAEVLEAIAGAGAAQPTEALAVGAFEAAVEHLGTTYDTEFGGFGEAPKFPRPTTLHLLLRHARRTHDLDALNMVGSTLQGMYLGGMYDHLGGGFARYSTDKTWLVPHFEKMLYDNAQLVSAYLDAFLLTGETAFADVVHDTLAYVRQDLTSPEGAFYCAEDADSEGREGAFYVWTPDQLAAALEPEDAAIAARRFGVTDQGNFEGGGETVLHLASSIEDTARHFGKSPNAMATRLHEIRAQLLESRDQRERPGLDDKVLTAWNGLMISAMAKAFWALGDERYLEDAVDAAEFVFDHLFEGDRLMRRWRAGEARFDAYLDDHAFLASACLDLYQVTFEEGWVERAEQLMDRAIEVFWDSAEGGFFYAPEAHDPHLAVRTRDAYDGAIPSGNSEAVHALLRLHALTGRSDFRDRAYKTLLAFGQHLERAPQALPWMVAAQSDLEAGPVQIVLAGDLTDPRSAELLAVIRDQYLPGAVVALAGPDAALAVAKDRTPVDGAPAVYVCRNFACDLPVTDPDKLAESLTGLFPKPPLPKPPLPKPPLPKPPLPKPPVEES